MSNKQVNKVTTVLFKIRDYLSNPYNWCPEGIGMNGENVLPSGHRQHCVLRAMSHILDAIEPSYDDGWEVRTAHNQLREAVCQRISCAAMEHFKVCTITVNGQGHSSVLRLLDCAIDDEVRNEL